MVFLNLLDSSLLERTPAVRAFQDDVQNGREPHITMQDLLEAGYNPRLHWYDAKLNGEDALAVGYELDGGRYVLLKDVAGMSAKEIMRQYGATLVEALEIVEEAKR